MPSFLQLPNVPWWLLLIAIIPIGLYVLLCLTVPFSVFGLKGRLEAIEARLDDMHEDIRSVALLHQAGGRRDARADERDDSFVHAPPPIAPARPADVVLGRRTVTAPASRAEPRLDWPK